MHAHPSSFRVLCLAWAVIAFGAVQSDSAAAAAGNRAQQAALANQAYWVEELVQGLNFPSSMVWLPNRDMLIPERMGGLRIVRAGRLDPTPIDGTPPRYVSVYDGLRDIALDPDFARNRTLYLLVSDGTFDAHYAAVYRARLTGNTLQDVARIFRSTESVGGAAVSIVSRMLMLADGTLLFAVAQDHAQPRAQRLDSHMGKILRINPDGSVPQDNPFRNTSGALPEIWSYGHRVPLGFYQDPQTQTIWEVEPGPRGGDELNVLKAGANYGWAKASWGFSYHNQGLEAPVQSGPGIEDPIHVWMPSSTPAGLTQLRGGVYPQWEGDYFLGTLTDRSLVRLRLEGGRVILQERLLLDLEERIRDVKVGPDGLLYVLTDHPNGRVLRLRPGRSKPADVARVARKLSQDSALPTAGALAAAGEERLDHLTSAELAKGKQAFLERCAGCHRIGAAIDGGSVGPDLEGIYGRLMGRRPGFDYSPNMAGGLFPWQPARLDRFLAAPNSIVPGTRMVVPPLTDAEVRQNIIGFLRQQSKSAQAQ